MITQQIDMKIPTSLIPHCPKCGAPMTMNLRCNQTFVQDDGWYQAKHCYEDFIRRYKALNIVYLQLGVGGNTPAIIKYPFWNYTHQNKDATYACINLGDVACPQEIKKQSILIDGDIHQVLCNLLKTMEK